LGFRENDGCELDDPRLLDAASMDRLCELLGRRESEVRRYRALEGRLRTALVLAPRRRDDTGEPDVVTASPVAGYGSERRKARGAAAGRPSAAVAARAADDRDPPAAVRSRP